MLVGRNTGPGLAEDYFAETHELGLNWLELGGNRPANFPPAWTQERIDNVKRRSEQFGIAYCLHSASFVNTAEIMPGVREASVQHLLDYIRLAAKMEARHLVVHFGYHFSLFPEQVYESLLSTYRVAVEEAERLKVPLMVENMNLLHPDAEILYLGTTVEELKVVFDSIDSPYLGLALDIGHANLIPGGVEPFINAFGPRIGGTHLSDNDGKIDRHWTIGSGTLPWAEMLGKLRAAGYGGSYTIELSTRNKVEPSVQYLKSIGFLPG